MQMSEAYKNRDESKTLRADKEDTELQLLRPRGES